MPSPYAKTSSTTSASNTSASKKILPNAPTTIITATTTAPLPTAVTEVTASNPLPHPQPRRLHHQVFQERRAPRITTPNMHSTMQVEARIRTRLMADIRIIWRIMPTTSSRLSKLLGRTLPRQDRLKSHHLRHQVAVRLPTGGIML